MRVPQVRSRDFSIVETVVALGIMALVMMAMIAAEVSGSQLRQTTRQSEWINEAVQEHYTNLRRLDTVTAVRDEVNGNADWTPLGPAESSVVNVSDGQFVSNGIVITAAPQRIMTEAECAAAFGGTFDLDRDGTPNSPTSDPNAYQTVVPVQLSVTWTNTLVGPGATRTLVFTTIIYPAGSLQ